MVKDVSTPLTEKFLIASEIIKGRELLGLTQAQLAEQSQVSLSAIKGYETGRNVPGARELKQLSQVLRISPNRLIFGVENPFPERTWSDPSVKQEFNTPSSRKRIEHLLQLLSSTECDSLYQIVYALAAARHGVEKASPLVRLADVETGINSFIDTGKFDPYLHSRLLRDTKVARAYASAIQVAAAETDAMNVRISAAPKSQKNAGNKPA